MPVSQGLYAQKEEAEGEEGEGGGWEINVFFFPPFFHRGRNCASLWLRLCSADERRGGEGKKEKEKLRLSAELYLPSPVGQLIWFVKYVNNQMINK